MAQPNAIGVVLDDASLNEVRSAIGVLKTKLLPVLKILPVQDRKELPKLGERTSDFVRKSQEYARIHPDLVPPYLDLDAFRVDLDALALLQTLERELSEVNRGLEDSIMLSGSEAYQAALLFYNNLKPAMKLNLGNSAAVYADLSSRFPGAPVKRAP